jgi:thiol-disulfide isomerase/thioredoxin
MSPISRATFLTTALALALIPDASAHSQDTAPLNDATAFLKWSMTRYQQLKTFQTTASWNSGFGESAAAADESVKTEQATSAQREFFYAAPNRFKVTTAHKSSFIQVSVCDGKSLIEYSTNDNKSVLRYDAPTELARIASMQMQHPMFCGTLLYRFFAGPSGIGQLVDENKKNEPIRFGGDVTIDGEPCRIVKFYGAKQYGNTQVAISTKDGLVRQIRYDSEPLFQMMAEQNPANAKMKSVTIERYSGLKTGEPIADTVFDTTIPKGSTPQNLGGISQAREDKPPVPFGKPAPAFTVTPLQGGALKTLASLRGKVVLIDFWATWCPPCVRGLPETLKLHKELASKGVAVLAVTDEETATVQKFIKSKGFQSLPVYRDATGAAGKAYKTEAIPTVAIIDRQGNLSAYFVGLQSPETLRAALKKAGA